MRTLVLLLGIVLAAGCLSPTARQENVAPASAPTPPGSSDPAHPSVHFEAPARSAAATTLNLTPDSYVHQGSSYSFHVNFAVKAAAKQASAVLVLMPKEGQLTIIGWANGMGAYSGGLGWGFGEATARRIILVAVTDDEASGLDVSAAIATGFSSVPETALHPPLATGVGASVGYHLEYAFVPIVLETKTSHGIAIEDSRVTTPIGASATGAWVGTARHALDGPGFSLASVAYFPRSGAGSYELVRSLDEARESAAGSYAAGPTGGFGAFATSLAPASREAVHTLEIRPVADALPFFLFSAVTVPIDPALLGGTVEKSKMEPGLLPPITLAIGGEGSSSGERSSAIVEGAAFAAAVPAIG